MKNILRFLANSKKVVLAILILLIMQAYCDLSLPTYTSELLNVGLQMGGIEDAACNTIRDERLELMKLFVSEEDAAVLESAYLPADENGIRALNPEADREVVAKLVMLPECIMYQLESQKGNGISLDMIQKGIESGMITREVIQERMQDATSMMEKMTDTYLNQVAVQYVSAEYEAQGLDLNAIRKHYLMVMGAKMLAVAFGMMAIAVAVGLLASLTSAKIGRDLRRELYEKVMSFTNAEMEKFSTSSLITRSTNDVMQIQIVSVMLLRMVIYAPILAIGGIIMVVRTHSGMSWIIVLAVIILAACVGVLMAVAMPKFRKMQTLIDHLNLVSREILTGIMPIRAFSREKHEEGRFEEANQNLYKTQLFTHRTMAFMMPIMMFVMNGISVLIVWIGAHRVNDGTIQVGDMTAFVTYSMVIVMGFLMVAMIAIMLPRAGVAADRIVEVLDMEVSLKDPVNPVKNAVSEGVLAFNDVTFCYPGAEGAALENISFTTKPGEITAIIGSTGCGKTTLLNLIPRFFDVTKGSITIDGTDIRSMTQHDLHALIGYAPQRGMLFSGTIESNLKYSGENVTDEDMVLAAQIAQAEEFIRSKADGYDSPIAQGGSNVSGGQKQRLSIARAIAKNPKIYLFDDSFSALDYKTDLALRKALASRTQNASVVIVAQRISTIMHANQIIVLDDGKIAGTGTHSELLKNCSTYQEIARSQLSEAELAQDGGEA